MAKKTTGRFETREELEERAIALYTDGLSMEEVAKNCEVSAGVISKIIENHTPATDAAGAPETAQEPTPEAPTTLPAVQGDQLPEPTGGDSSDPEFARLRVARGVAHTLSKSSLVPEAYRGRPADCFVAIQMGAEVGMGPFQAIQSIAVIDGKPCLYGDGLIGVVRASPLCMYVREWFSDDGQTAYCETLRRGDPAPIRREFNHAEAIAAGLTAKNVWKKYGRRMLQMRARAFCLRDAYPDVLKGLRVAEEVMDYSTEPAPVTTFDLPEAPATPQLAPPPEAKPVTLKEVLEKINGSDSMAELVRASDLAGKLTAQDDIHKARVAYKAKREELQPQTPGSTK